MMRAYLLSARFACACFTLLIGLSFLIGARLLPSDGETDLRYYLAVGAALCASGIALALVGRLGVALYAVVTAAAIAWTLFEYGLDLWQLPPHLFALLLWSGILFTLRDRIMRRARPEA